MVVAVEVQVEGEEAFKGSLWGTQVDYFQRISFFLLLHLPFPLDPSEGPNPLSSLFLLSFFKKNSDKEEKSKKDNCQGRFRSALNFGGSRKKENSEIMIV